MRRSRVLATGCLVAVLASQAACGPGGGTDAGADGGIVDAPSDTARDTRPTTDREIPGEDVEVPDVEVTDVEVPDSEVPDVVAPDGESPDVVATDAADVTPPPVDGEVVDGTSPGDAATDPDAVTPGDAAVDPDAVSPGDATTTTDGSSTDDAAVDPDAVTPGDATTTTDGSSTDDAAVMPDGAGPGDATTTPDVVTSMDATVTPDVVTPMDVPTTPDAAPDAAPDATPDARPLENRPVVFVLRVGNGLAALTSAGAPVYLEQRDINDGAPVDAPGPLPMVRIGTQLPFTLSGTGTTEGGMSRTANGRYVVFAGFGAPPGTENVASSPSTTVPRVIARADGGGETDTSTALGAAFSGLDVRGAASADGSRLYASGAAGVWSATLGATTAVQVLAAPANARHTAVFGTQLYGTSASADLGIFATDPALPAAAGATATLLRGVPAGAMNTNSSQGFALVRRAAGDGAPDTLYVADDRSIGSGGGVQRWTLGDGGSWTLSGTFSAGLSQGVRGVAVLPPTTTGGATIVAAVTGETPTRLVSYSDTGAAPAMAMARVLATASANTAFRGIALAPGR